MASSLQVLETDLSWEAQQKLVGVAGFGSPDRSVTSFFLGPLVSFSEHPVSEWLSGKSMQVSDA